MEKLTFYILDVFAEEKYEGNQLAVVRDAANLSDEQMQQIAKEINFSETTFILSEESRDNGYDVRIFTPAAEVPFAGHPTLGTAYVIGQEIIGQLVEQVNLNLKVGQIPVNFKKTDDGEDILWMKQIEPVFGEDFSTDDIARILRVDNDDIDNRFLIQDVSTGIPFIIVPLRNLEAAKRARINKDEYFKFIADKNAKPILVFCPQTYYQQNDLNVRVFGDCFGIPEDPATGSANGCLAGYLVKHKYLGTNKIDIRVEQGYEIGRPSLLYLKAKEKGAKINVSVGGKVTMIAEGKLV